MALRDFALPAPRVGSLESQALLGPLPNRGGELHLWLQAARASEYPGYQAEVPLAYTFESGELCVAVRGRVDGYAAAEALVEEIKSTYDPVGLKARLQADPEHPYCLQVRTYGYIVAKTTGLAPVCRLALVSARTKEVTTLEVPLAAEAYEAWLQRRLAGLAVEVRQELRERKRRRAAAARLGFPFSAPRRGQDELMRFINDAGESAQHLLLQAPTGLGKTVGILQPALKESLAAGKAAVFVTPKNSQQRGAERAAQSLAGVRTLTMAAKTHVCLKPEQRCTADYCEYARGYYDKLAEGDLVAKLARKRHVTADKLKAFGRKHQVCPAALALDAARSFDLIIGDYNHVITSHSLVGQVATSLTKRAVKPTLLIDEAHNWAERARGNLSSSLSKQALEQHRQALGGDSLSLDALRQTNELLSVAAQQRGALTQALLEPAVDAAEAAWVKVIDRAIERGEANFEGDPALQAVSYWRGFHEAFQQLGAVEAEVATYALFVEAEQGDLQLRVICLDPAAYLEEKLEPFGRVIAFSATLAPFEFYARLGGFRSDSLATAAFASPFPAEHRKVMVIPQVSTRLRDRTASVPRIAEAIERITRVRMGNYLVLFPSFAFLQATYAQAEAACLAAGYRLIRQTAGMGRAACEDALRSLHGSEPTLLFGVNGGSFSEGVDYAGDALIGVLMVGPPLPSVSGAQEALERYYERRYGKGREYGSVIPAVTKVIQAAGRVIRSETDRGLIVLMDRRFAEPAFQAHYPSDWLEGGSERLASRTILRDIAAFWQGPAEAKSEGVEH